MAWIEAHQTLSRHTKTLDVAEKLGVSRHLVIGHLMELWWWALDNVQSNGHIGNVSNTRIAIAACWDGDADEFANALIEAGFIEEREDGRWLHDWYDYAGKLLVKREKDAERKRKSNGTPSEIQRNSSGIPSATVPNRTVPNRTVPNHKDIKEDEKIHTESSFVNTKEQKKSSSFDPKFGELVRQFESDGFGTLNSVIAEQLGTMYQEFGFEWVSNAMKEAVLSGKRTLRFVNGILQNWRREGGMHLTSVKGIQGVKHGGRNSKRTDPSDDAELEAIEQAWLERSKMHLVRSEVGTAH